MQTEYAITSPKSVMILRIILLQISFWLVFSDSVQDNEEPKYLLIRPNDVKLPLHEPLSTRNDLLRPNTEKVVLIHGPEENSTQKWYQKLSKAYLSYVDNKQVIEIIWSGKNWLNDSNLPEKIDTSGKKICSFMINLAKVENFNISDYHIVAHSLGCHVAGSVGKCIFNVSGDQVGRITALDEERSVFLNGNEGYGIKRGDAKVVVGIHTDGDGMGVGDPYGDVDFFLNGGNHQPGCKTEAWPYFVDYCSHHRSYEYWTEAVNRNRFFGTQCPSWQNFKNGSCSHNRILNFVGKIRKEDFGLYFAETNGKRPYLSRGSHSVEIQKTKNFNVNMGYSRTQTVKTKHYSNKKSHHRTKSRYSAENRIHGNYSVIENTFVFGVVLAITEGNKISIRNTNGLPQLLPKEVQDKLLKMLTKSNQNVKNGHHMHHKRIPGENLSIYKNKDSNLGHKHEYDSGQRITSGSQSYENSDGQYSEGSSYSESRSQSSSEEDATTDSKYKKRRKSEHNKQQKHTGQSNVEGNNSFNVKNYIDGGNSYPDSSDVSELHPSDSSHDEDSPEPASPNASVDSRNEPEIDPNKPNESSTSDSHPGQSTEKDNIPLTTEEPGELSREKPDFRPLEPNDGSNTGHTTEKDISISREEPIEPSKEKPDDGTNKSNENTPVPEWTTSEPYEVSTSDPNKDQTTERENTSRNTEEPDEHTKENPDDGTNKSDDNTPVPKWTTSQPDEVSTNDPNKDERTERDNTSRNTEEPDEHSKENPDDGTNKSDDNTPVPKWTTSQSDEVSTTNPNKDQATERDNTSRNTEEPDEHSKENPDDGTNKSDDNTPVPKWTTSQPDEVSTTNPNKDQTTERDNTSRNTGEPDEHSKENPDDGTNKSDDNTPVPEWSTLLPNEVSTSDPNKDQTSERDNTSRNTEEPDEHSKEKTEDGPSTLEPKESSTTGSNNGSSGEKDNMSEITEQPREHSTNKPGDDTNDNSTEPYLTTLESDGNIPPVTEEASGDGENKPDVDSREIREKPSVDSTEEPDVDPNIPATNSKPNEIYTPNSHEGIGTEKYQENNLSETNTDHTKYVHTIPNEEDSMSSEMGNHEDKKRNENEHVLGIDVTSHTKTELHGGENENINKNNKNNFAPGSSNGLQDDLKVSVSSWEDSGEINGSNTKDDEQHDNKEFYDDNSYYVVMKIPAEQREGLSLLIEKLSLDKNFIQRVLLDSNELKALQQNPGINSLKKTVQIYQDKNSENDTIPMIVLTKNDDNFELMKNPGIPENVKHQLDDVKGQSDVGDEESERTDAHQDTEENNSNMQKSVSKMIRQKTRKIITKQKNQVFI